MITSKQEPLPSATRLDAASRRVIARFCFEVAWFGMIAFAPALTGIVAVANAAASLGTYCSFAALLRVLVAARRKEKPCVGSLNGWDECLALVAAAMLAYFASRVLQSA